MRAEEPSPTATNGTGKHPIAKNETKQEAQRRYWREAYHKSRKRILTKRKEPKATQPKMVPRIIDVLVYINHALAALEKKDTEGVELYLRLAKRTLKGKD